MLMEGEGSDEVIWWRERVWGRQGRVGKGKGLWRRHEQMGLGGRGKGWEGGVICP